MWYYSISNHIGQVSHDSIGSATVTEANQKSLTAILLEFGSDTGRYRVSLFSIPPDSNGEWSSRADHIFEFNGIR